MSDIWLEHFEKSSRRQRYWRRYTDGEICPLHAPQKVTEIIIIQKKQKRKEQTRKHANPIPTHRKKGKVENKQNTLGADKLQVLHANLGTTTSC